MKEPIQKIHSYNSYLLYKHVIDIIRKEPCSRVYVANKLDVKVEKTWAVFRALLKWGVIKRIRYDCTKGGKRAIYQLVKDE